MSEARLEDGVPQTAGWFVINARDTPWMHNDMRAVAKFGGEGDTHFDDLGIALYWLEPGQPMSMYHHERGQEDFLVLRGRALAIVEGEERPLEAWDLLHCPSRSATARASRPRAPSPPRGSANRGRVRRPTSGDQKTRIATSAGASNSAFSSSSSLTSVSDAPAMSSDVQYSPT